MTHGSVQLQGTQLLQSQQRKGRQAAAPTLKTKAGLRQMHRQTRATHDRAPVAQRGRRQKSQFHNKLLKRLKSYNPDTIYIFIFSFPVSSERKMVNMFFFCSAIPALAHNLSGYEKYKYLVLRLASQNVQTRL